MSTFTNWQATRKRNPRLWLGYVMLGVVAQSDECRKEIAAALTKQLPREILHRAGQYIGPATTPAVPATADGLADFAREVLNMPTADVRVVNRALNGILRGMCRMDWFGTEGQCDPRGDHR